MMSMDAGWAAVALTAAGCGATALSWLITKSVRVLRKVDEFIDDFRGSAARPGVRAQPGVLERLSIIEDKQSDMAAQLEQVHHETQPNGGWSMKDQMNRIDPAFGPEQQ